MTQQLIEALRQLDPSNDNHWTSDGLPRLETVRLLASDSTINREAVTAAAPGFTRANSELQAADPASTEQGGGSTSIAAPAAAQGDAQGDSDGTQAGQGDGAGDLPLDEAEPADTSAEDRIEALKAELAEAESAAAQANQKRAEAVAALDAALDAAASARPQTTLAEQVRAYQQRQLANAQQRAERRGGPSLSAIKSPLDLAFGRRTARGTQRPSIPLKKD